MHKYEDVCMWVSMQGMYEYVCMYVCMYVTVISIIGQQLEFNILSTWGDPHYLGLMGNAMH